MFRNICHLFSILRNLCQPLTLMKHHPSLVSILKSARKSYLVVKLETVFKFTILYSGFQKIVSPSPGLLPPLIWVPKPIWLKVIWSIPTFHKIINIYSSVSVITNQTPVMHSAKDTCYPLFSSKKKLYECMWISQFNLPKKIYVLTRFRVRSWDHFPCHL